MRYPVTLHVNETSYPVEIEADRTLLSVLRGELGLTGTRVGPNQPRYTNAWS